MVFIIVYKTRLLLIHHDVPLGDVKMRFTGYKDRLMGDYRAS